MLPEQLSRACLRAINAVVQEGTFTGAGRAIGLSHAAIAQQIRGFEQRHGTRLFDRVQGRFVPTPFCTDLAEAAERLNEVEAEVSRLLARRDSSGQLRMRVGLGNSMPGIAIVGRVIASHPGVSVTVESGAHQAILSAVLRREVDVAILPDIPPDRRFRRQPIQHQQVVAIMAENHPLAGRRELSLHQLSQEALIFRSRGSSTQKVVDRAFARAGLTPQPRVIADTRDAVYEAVSLGIGVGFMWHRGTHRFDSVQRVPVAGMGAGSEEVVFALAEDRHKLTDMFFLAAREYASSPDPEPPRKP
ncbi:MAG: LysR family transcriptional regulator [Paracoccus sp. (in: a-proteobacteria)]|nr:LysR family transcriptional regulator [Paracoccus sp. (in: a-proteobacteria)]